MALTTTNLCPNKTLKGYLWFTSLTFIFHFFEVLVPSVITMEYLVIRPWGSFGLPGFVWSPWIQQWCCTGSLEAAVELELPRLTTFPAYKGTEKGGRPRCSRCHIPIADLRQGYVRAVLDSLPVWAGEDVAETKVALLIFPPCCFSYANMNSTSSRVLCFCPVFVLFCTSGSEAVLRFVCSSLRWQKLDLFFFLFFFQNVS